MAKFSAALRNLETKNAKVARVSYNGKSHLEMEENQIYRVKSNGSKSAARIGSDDLLADDWKVLKD